MKKILAVILCALIVGTALSACGAKKEPAESGLVGMTNPYTEYKTLQEAENAVGFGVSFPSIIKPTMFIAIDGKILDLRFDGGYLRKAYGVKDISGDYNEYETKETKELGDYSVTIKGNGGNADLAIWTRGGYSYCVSRKGTSEKEMLAIVQTVE